MSAPTRPNSGTDRSRNHSQEPRHSRFIYLRLLWNNLGVHPLRSVLTAIAIGLQVFLILLIVGLTTGSLGDWRARAEGVGADLIIQPPNSSFFMAFSSATMPSSLAASIEKQPGVDEVAPVFSVTDSKSLVIVYGIDFQRFNGLGKGFTFLSGGPFTGSNDAIADDLAAKGRKLKVGGAVSLMNHTFRVSGIVANGKGARFFVPLPTAQDLWGSDENVSLMYVRTTGNTAAVQAALTKLLPGYKVLSMAEFMSQMTASNLPALTPFIHSFVGLGIVISFLVILLTMYTMVLERRREIGILKALGSSRLEICRLILAEALLLVVFGVVFGLAGTYGTTAILHRATPTLQIRIPSQWIYYAILLAIAGALAGATYPALRAARSDPVDALAYE